MKGNPDGSLSNYSSLRTLKASGFIDSLKRAKRRVFFFPGILGFPFVHIFQGALHSRPSAIII